MSKIFPSMNSKPEKFTFITTLIYWPFVFLWFPIYLPYLGMGLWEDPNLGPWLEIGYHVVNFIVLLICMKSYLKDEWFMVTTDVRFYIKHMALTVGLIVGTVVFLLGTLYLYGFNIGYMLNGLPVAEMTVSHTAGMLILQKPLFGTIALTILSPISICATFYCLCFAPFCYRRPWLGYLSVVVVTLIPSLIDIIWRGDASLVLSMYFIRLPIHLLACWSYQKTDNVWTPIGALVGTNLILSVGQLLLWALS